MGWGWVGAAGETSASGRASCVSVLGSAAFLGPLSNFPSPKSSRRCLPEYSEKAGARSRGGARPPRDFLRFELPRSPAPPQGVLPGIPQAPLHGAESRPHPLTEALGEFKHLLGILHRPKRHPSGEPPTRFRPSRRRPRPPLRLGPLLCPRPPPRLCLTFSSASLSLNFLSPAPRLSLQLSVFCRTIKIQRKAVSLLSCSPLCCDRGVGWGGKVANG